MSSGSLTVVGTGIEVGSHLTQAAREEIEAADIVLCLVAEPVTNAWLESLNPNVRSLHGFYRLGEEPYRDRLRTTCDFWPTLRSTMQCAGAELAHRRGDFAGAMRIAERVTGGAGRAAVVWMVGFDGNDHYSKPSPFCGRPPRTVRRS